MENYKLPHFGEIKINSLKDYYDVEIEFNGRKIELDLNFEEESIETDKLEIVKKIIDNLSEYNSIAEKALISDFEEDDTVKDYIEHHLEEIDDIELKQIIDKPIEEISAEKQMLTKLFLKRVGFYPGDEDDFAIFDFTIGEDLTQYIIAITFNEDIEVQYMSMES